VQYRAADKQGLPDENAGEGQEEAAQEEGEAESANAEPPAKFNPEDVKVVIDSFIEKVREKIHTQCCEALVYFCHVW
jgi:hypothetical protein